MRLQRTLSIRSVVFAVGIILSHVNIKAQTTPVDAYGQLSVSGTNMVDQNGNPVMLRGMSLFWSQWEGEFYAYNSILQMRDDWCTNIVRAAMAVDESGGYLSNPGEIDKVRTVVDAAIDLGMYVIIDWHTHHGEDYTSQAVSFFNTMAQEYGNYPNVLFEVYNEPLNVNWSNTIKPYCETVIAAIRQHSDNIIICGTRNWSQRVDEAAANPITGYSNIMYTLHYYAGTHGAELRGWAETAMNNGIALFVTEFGTVNADGGGAVNVGSSNTWFDWMAQHNLSHCNWSLCDKNEGSATLTPGTGPNDDFASRLTTAGNFMYNYFTSDCPVYEVSGPPSIKNQPDNQTVSEGETATFTVSASGSSLQYQWQKDGVNIPGANSNTLTITNVDPSDEATYRVIVSNNEGTETSNGAILNILSPGPFNGEPFPIPGRIEAEEFDEGGQNDTYYDATAGNEGGDFRDTDVDIEANLDQGGNYSVGWIDDGEWLEYSVDVQATGTYDFEFRVATPENGKTFNIAFDGNNVTGTVNVPNTGGWSAYQTVTINDVDLTAGEHTMRFNATSTGFNINYINVIAQSIPDCAGVPDGSAYIDECGDCVGGTTGLTTLNSDNDGQPDCIDTDDDNDGVPDTDDCDPLDPAVGAAQTWFADNDGDGLGDANNTVDACDQPTDYVANSNDNNDNDFDNDGVDTDVDCDDTNTSIGAATIYYEDADGDGIGAGTGTGYCSDPGTGWVLINGDECDNDINKTTPGDCGCGIEEGSCNDCAGVPNGTATIDVCGICAGGTTGITPGASCEPPVITDQPDDVTTDQGTNATFTVTATGSGTLAYQWQFNGEDIQGADQETLTINNVSFSDAGAYTVIVTNADGYAVSDAATLSVTIDGQAPYNGTPIQIPGTLEVEEFDLGGQGVAYDDDNVANEGGAFRPTERVDIEATEDNTGDYNVGWTVSGEWLEYTVEVTETGYFDFDFRVASDLDAGEFNIEVNGTPIIDNVTVGNTGGWQGFVTVSQQNVQLAAGVYVWRLNIIDGEFNINYITVTQVPTDCNGDPNGTAYLDECGACVGGLTGNESADSDNDGVLDCNDQCPLDGDKTEPGLCGCGNVDEDIDNDGICDLEDNFIDIDEDGIPQPDDCDDNDENVGTATIWYEDADNDGLGDENNVTTACDQPAGYVAVGGDNCPQDVNKSEPGLCGCGFVDEDVDNDGVCDLEDDDLDNDGVPANEDCDDNDPNIGTVKVWYEDADNDGLGDAGNTIAACAQPNGYIAVAGDNCPQDGDKSVPGLCGCGNVDEDVDNDGICDLEDNDLDNDLVPSNQDCDDRNPSIGAATVWYADADNDGFGDVNASTTACTKPSGYVAQAGDQCPSDNNKQAPGGCGCGVADVDSDNDGVLDCDDICQGGDDNLDFDNDGIPDACDQDDDNDNVADNNDCEPYNQEVGGPSIWYADLDGDGYGQASMSVQDCDQPDGYVAIAGDNCPQNGNKQNPGLCGCDESDVDSDGDGAPNCFDQCPSDPLKIQPGICGCGVIDKDSDNDGVCDVTDDDLDNDGVTNDQDCAPTNPNIGLAKVWYLDADGDGVGVTSISQTSCIQPNGYVSIAGDNCPQDINKTSPGDCGCGVPAGSCLDCAGIPFGNAYYDNCDVCVTSAAEECEQDCNGDWGGTATQDVCGICSGGNTGREHVTDSQKCSATGVEDELDKINARVYPNPFEGAVKIEVEGSFDLVVYSITGIEVQRISAIGSVKIGDWWKPGMYIVQILKGDYAVNVKVEKH